MPHETIPITLPTEIHEFAKGLVDGEIYISVSDVIVEALYRFRTVIENERREEAWLKAEIQKGIDELDRGEGIDGETFMAELLARVRTREVAPTP